MDTRAYPGQGLSLSQLVFALNEEVKRVAYCSSFTFDAVAQLDRDTSSALANIREWKNSFAPINRVPLEVLSLIPTHFSYESDLLHATSVCRHWHRTFTQRATLWSELNLVVKRSPFFVKTLLERAKGSALDITSACLDRTDILALLGPHAQNFRKLDFVYGYWSDIQMFSEAASGPLPLLQTLKIHVADFNPLAPEPADFPILPLFTGAVNLKEFRLYSEGLPFLNHFAFPHLTTFDLTVELESGSFPASQLLNFLEATPTLRVVHVKIEGEISLVDAPPERIVILPNVERLAVTGDGPRYEVAAHISCPSAKRTSLIHEEDLGHVMPQEVFPTSVSWNVIAPQHMASQIDEVALGITTARNFVVSCSLSFLSPGLATLELGYRMFSIYDDDDDDDDHEESDFSLGQKHVRVFSQASKTIRNHPLLANVKRFLIQDSHAPLTSNQLTRVADEVGQLFRSIGPLEELTLDVVDLRPYLALSIDLPEFDDVKRSGAYPQIKELTIIERSQETIEEECFAAIVEFAKSQHALGVPFERMIFRVKESPVEMAERLGPWVGAVDCYEMIIADDQDE
ncbi:hypothetical protein BDM02DRAFT_3183927 [Thelephora ganbajun]|uniref:Uncharacterized protein n=1 Tax=Thelephora ganbajun TaxID=370292 RepID=A0ACB6ZS39_THEGA|nr:hypothetical protein BDM02DRAFT_3183927 [Thelephora ganbajun]